MCKVGLCHKVFMEVRGRLCGVASLFWILESNMGPQAYAASDFTCKAILVASVWNFYKELRNIGSRVKPCCPRPPCFCATALPPLSVLGGVESPGMGLGPLGKVHSRPIQRVELLSHPVILVRKQKVGWGVGLPLSIFVILLFFGYVYIAFAFSFICF